VFPAIVAFFSSEFPNQKSELHYVKENWFVRKVRRLSWDFHISSSHAVPVAAARVVVFPISGRQLGGQRRAHSRTCSTYR
jgi:hypothetical protein